MPSTRSTAKQSAAAQTQGTSSSGPNQGQAQAAQAIPPPRLLGRLPRYPTRARAPVARDSLIGGWDGVRIADTPGPVAEPNIDYHEQAFASIGAQPRQGLGRPGGRAAGHTIKKRARVDEDGEDGPAGPSKRSRRAEASPDLGAPTGSSRRTQSLLGLDRDDRSGLTSGTFEREGLPSLSSHASGHGTPHAPGDASPAPSTSGRTRSNTPANENRLSRNGEPDGGIEELAGGRQQTGSPDQSDQALRQSLHGLPNITIQPQPRDPGDQALGSSADANGESDGEARPGPVTIDLTQGDDMDAKFDPKHHDVLPTTEREPHDLADGVGQEMGMDDDEEAEAEEDDKKKLKLLKQRAYQASIDTEIGELEYEMEMRSKNKKKGSRSGQGACGPKQ